MAHGPHVICACCLDVLLTEYESAKGYCLSCVVEPYHSRGLPEPMGNYMSLLMNRQLAEEAADWHPRALDLEIDTSGVDTLSHAQLAQLDDEIPF